MQSLVEGSCNLKEQIAESNNNSSNRLNQTESSTTNLTLPEMATFDENNPILLSPLASLDRY